MNKYIVYISIHLVTLLTSISASAVSVAFPEIISSFKASLVLAGWVISIYQLVAVCMGVLTGKLCDIYGRKTVFLACTFLFILGSLLCALAPNIQLLIAFRLVQSFGGGAILPAIVGIVVQLFPKNRQRAISWGMSFFVIGGIIGPGIGAWLLTSFGWRSIFWFNVPIGLLCSVPVLFLLKTDAGIKSKIDFRGITYITGMIFTLMIALSQIGHSKTTGNWWLVVLLFTIGILFLLLFIHHERRDVDPVIDRELLQLRPFAATNIYNTIFGACTFGITSFIPLFVISVYGMSEIESGLVLSIRSAGMILATIASGFFMLRWGYRSPLIIASILFSCTSILLGLEPRYLNIFHLEVGALAIICMINMFAGISMGIAIPAVSNCCIDLIPQKAAAITGVSTLFRMGGGAVCIPIITLLLEYMANISQGFEVTFISTGIVVLITIPVIFFMPERMPVGPKKG